MLYAHCAPNIPYQAQRFSRLVTHLIGARMYFTLTRCLIPYAAHWHTISAMHWASGVEAIPRACCSVKVEIECRSATIIIGGRGPVVS